MYTQTIDVAPRRRNSRTSAARRPDLAFEARIARDDRIEPQDLMPDAYRKTLIRQISQHAHSEVVGMLPEGGWITRRLHSNARKSCSPRCRDEGGRALPLGAAPNPGCQSGRTDRCPALGQSQVFEHLQLPHGHVGRHRHHRLAGGRCGNHESGATLPLQLRAVRPGDDPGLQRRVVPSTAGFRHRPRALRGTPEQKAMAQDSVNRWWWPTLMMFGPHDTDSQHTGQAMNWGIKRISNDDLRQKFVDVTVPQAEYLGLTLPDPALKWNAERGHYDFGKINWDEFWRVVNGDGPCNAERLHDRVQAFEDGRWVREAAMAHAAKQASRIHATQRMAHEHHPATPTSTQSAWPLFKCSSAASRGSITSTLAACTPATRNTHWRSRAMCTPAGRKA